MAYVVIEYEQTLDPVLAPRYVVSVGGTFAKASDANAYCQRMNELHNEDGFEYEVEPLLNNIGDQ